MSQFKALKPSKQYFINITSPRGGGGKKRVPKCHILFEWLIIQRDEIKGANNMFSKQN